MSSLKLYTNQICPFAHRARLALTFKGVEHERIEVDLAEMPAWYKELSPNQAVPLLMHGDQKIWESAVINEYLEDRFPARRLTPEDPVKRAHMRIAVEVAGSKFIPLFYGVLRGQKSPDELPAAFAALERSMSGEGPFWMGSEPTLADLDIYPWFERWDVLAHYRNVAAVRGRLGGWLEAMRRLPEVQKEVGDGADYVRGYSRYVN